MLAIAREECYRHPPHRSFGAADFKISADRNSSCSGNRIFLESLSYSPLYIYLPARKIILCISFASISPFPIFSIVWISKIINSTYMSTLSFLQKWVYIFIYTHVSHEVFKTWNDWLLKWPTPRRQKWKRLAMSTSKRSRRWKGLNTNCRSEKEDTSNIYMYILKYILGMLVFVCRIDYATNDIYI